MKNLTIRVVLLLSLYACMTINLYGQETKLNEWQPIFDGKTLNEWKANERTESFAVSKGMIVADGGRSHLFYTGPVADANFKNLEFKVDVMTEPGANSGIYIHTQFQDKGWLTNGYEIQISNSSTDRQKTGSIYNIAPTDVSMVNDLEWFTMHIIIIDQKITVKVNNEVVVNYLEKDPEKPIGKFTEGTIALQAHSQGSVCYFKNFYIRLLP